MNHVKAVKPIVIVSERPSNVAVVTETHNGEALKLSDLQGRDMPLRRNLSQVSWLESGDEVLITETPEGAVINGRLRRIGETPQATLSMHENGLALRGDRPLCLQVDESRLELRPDGQIRIEGRVITQQAADSMRLFGPTVEVN